MFTQCAFHNGLAVLAFVVKPLGNCRLARLKLFHWHTHPLSALHSFEIYELSKRSPSQGSSSSAPSRKARNASHSPLAARARKNSSISKADSFSATARLINCSRLVPSAAASLSAAALSDG